jgi:hypothetical protein
MIVNLPSSDSPMTTDHSKKEDGQENPSVSKKDTTLFGV